MTTHRPSTGVLCLALAASALALAGTRLVGAPSRQSPPAGTTAPPAAALEHPSISRIDAVTELDGLLRAIDNVHPNPFHVTSRESLAADRQRIIADLPDTMTTTEWWRRLSQLVARIGDGHTTMAYPFAGLILDQLPSLLQEAKDNPSQRPGTFRFRTFPQRTLGLDDAGNLRVTLAGGVVAGLKRGDRVLTINGRSADALIADWTQEMSGDSPENRVAAVVDDFPLLLLLHSMPPPYSLTVAADGGSERTVMVEGARLELYADSAQPERYFSYRTLEPGIGYMDFVTMDGSRRAFKKALAKMFRQVAADSVRTLIVDLRGNGGGYEEFGNDLLAYMTTKPYRNWGRREIKRSAEMRAFGKSEYIPWPVRWLPVQYLIPDGHKFYTGAVGTMAIWPEPMPKAHRRSEPFFSGAVCVLTGARTFSAAVVLADTIKTYHLATLVGEETGGHPNMYSAQYVYPLPRSRLSAMISAAYSVRASGDEHDAGGVVPDIAVHTTAVDIRDGRDPVVERARECPSIAR